MYYREQNDVTSASSSTSMNEPKFGIIEILPIVLQKGVLRTNCIDSRDRTNRAQIVDGLVGLGRQLKALVQTKGLEIHIEEPLSSTLMLFYEEMGDALALQFTGSAAQNKVYVTLKLSSQFEYWKELVGQFNNLFSSYLWAPPALVLRSWNLVAANGSSELYNLQDNKQCTHFLQNSNSMQFA